MKPVNIREAKTHLSRLVARVEAGEEIVIAKAGRPVARLVPIDNRFRPVKTGGLRLPHEIPDDFDTMFESGIASLFFGLAARPRAPGARRA